MKLSILPAAIAAAVSISALSGCSNTTDGIGGSLITDETAVVVADDFEITGRSSVSNVPIQSRTITQLLGDIDAKGYGSFSSEIVTQFMPTQTIDTTGVRPEYVDSLQLVFAMSPSACIGDSIVPMGLKVYRLDKQLPSPIYSNFDPKDYYNPETGLLGEQIYSFNVIEAPDSISSLSSRYISVNLPVSLGREFFELYKKDPSAYATPQNFAKHFPGIAVVNSFGSGRVVEIGATAMQLYYHTFETDTLGKPVAVPAVGTYFAVTPEIVSNNVIDYTISPELEARINAGENIIVAPAGRDVEINFPAKEVMEYYEANRGTLAVVNTMTFSIPAEKIENDYNIGVPEQILMVKTSYKDKFFLENKVPDNVESFYADYNSTKQAYNFSGLRPYFMNLLEKYGTAADIPEDELKFTLVPVYVETESVSNGYYSSPTVYVNSVTPYIQRPAMVKLDLKEAKVTLTFSKRTVK